LIVEDEEIISHGLLTTISWTEYGFEPIAVCKNGQEALDVFHRLDPDVILTDIKMPLMDGLELLEVVKKVKSDTQVVLVSGFKEFDYAKKGIEYGVFAYLLKDSLHEDITRYFPRLREHLDNIRKNSNSNQKINIISSRLQLDNDDEFPIEKHKLYSCIVIYSPVKNPISLPIDEKTMNVLLFRKSGDHNPICILGTDNEKDMNRLTMHIVSLLLENNQADCILGISGIIKERTKLSKVYLEAVKSVDYGRVYGKNINYYQKLSLKKLDKFFDSPNQAVMDSAVMLCEKQNIVMYINNLFMNALENFSELIPDIHVKCTRILERFLYYMELLGMGTEFIIHQLEMIHIMDSYIDCKDWMLENISVLCDLLEKQRMMTGKESTCRAVKLVDDNFQDNLNLELVARYCCMTPSGFSVKFKEATGSTFSTYIKEKRIQHACYLLQSSNLKIYEIAKECGYDDEKYFCRIFKSIMQLSPGRYRRKK
jgi:two-component system response regulator YesN